MNKKAKLRKQFEKEDHCIFLNMQAAPKVVWRYVEWLEKYIQELQESIEVKVRENGVDVYR